MGVRGGLGERAEGSGGKRGSGGKGVRGEGSGECLPPCPPPHLGL